ncbi:hypothetical protein G9C85_04850 [Halorubellus sp. JP-L1]|uniref:hypothetical protein n=1 Tax=Halorubellus sp. JP-L1 TaxID=2715753 RepID=UPI00140BF774|nr:hypothetical protein [Halorubellus sp. JP-L1]NHN40965.1 hypothetical protein [Halorubellus sp. JP-L1]
MTERTADEDLRDRGFAGTVVENSRVGSVVSSAAAKGTGVVERVANFVRGSSLYRWLTAEPEPDVVVIDLRETYTIGPFIRLLDAIIECLQPYWEASTIKRATETFVRGMERAAETKPGRVLASILAPPEPPARADPGSDHGEDDPKSADDTGEDRERP